MGQSFFKKKLSTAAQKKAAASVEAERANSAAQKKAAPEIYDDVTVCRLLGIRRRVIAAARTKPSRGTDWDCVGLHAGMTRAWIDRYALEHAIAPRFTSVPLAPITDGDGIASVILVGTHPNPCRCTVELLASGERMFATVRNLYEYPIHLREAFDCLVIDGKLQWWGRINEVQY